MGEGRRSGQHGGVIPVVTPEEMGAIDAAAPEPVEVLIDRAGAAVARAALDLLGGAYGRRVVVVAGKGNNGADGRAAAGPPAAPRRAGRGARRRRPPRRPAPLRPARRRRLRHRLPRRVDAAPGAARDSPVLAVDIPSGVDGLTGEAHGRPWAADRTVTFAALKPGLLLRDGPDLAGEVEVADIGLDVSSARAHVVEGADVASWLPDRPRDAHKWRAACWIVAGSPGMTGAAHLSAAGAQRAGAGYVRLSTPGLARDPGAPTEVVGVDLPAEGWAGDVLADVDRIAALAVGPGLGRGEAAAVQVRALVGAADRPPMVVDGDGLSALADDRDGDLTRPRPARGRRHRRGGQPVRRTRRWSSPPTTASWPAWAATPTRPTDWPRCGPWPPAAGRWCWPRGRPPWWPTPAGGWPW